MKIIIEPFKIKSVEPININSLEDRKKIISTDATKKGGGVELTPEQLRAKNVERYRDIMDIKGMNKEAAYKSLVDASKLIQESQDFKGDIRSGKLINQVIQAASKQFDKPAKTSDAINTLILQNELKKDLNKEENALANLLKQKQIQIADKTLAGDTFEEIITERIKKGDARPFKVAKNIKFLVVDKKTGEKADFGSKTTIIEAFKKDNLSKKFNINDNLNLKIDKNNILKFY